MAIYGTGLLAICLLAGLFFGRALGGAMGIEANVGGVGFAMLLLIIASDALRKRGLLSEPTAGGVLFWSSIYIPIVVAMAASQNVKAALSGGTAAITAGVAVVAFSYLMIPLLMKLGPSKAEGAQDGGGPS